MRRDGRDARKSVIGIMTVIQRKPRQSTVSCQG
jgi:hypothetical protein